MKHINGLRRHSDVFGTWYFYTSKSGKKFYIYRTGDGMWKVNELALADGELKYNLIASVSITLAEVCSMLDNQY